MIDQPGDIAEEAELVDPGTELQLLVASHMPSDQTLDRDQRAALDNIHIAMAPNTSKAYMADLKDYLSWLATEEERDQGDLFKPTAIAAYLTYAHKAGLAVSSIKRRVAAIHKLFQAIVIVTDPDQVSYDPTKHPVVKAAVAAIAAKGKAQRIARHENPTRSNTKATRGPAEPLTGELLVQLLASITNDRPADQRDIALLLIGWFGALRPSELVAIRTAHVRIEDAGVIITLPASKADPEPKDVAIAAHPKSRWDPARHLSTWIEILNAHTALYGGDNTTLWAATTRSGTLARPTRPIAVRTLTDLLKRRAKVAGITTRTNINGDSENVDFSNHSLRAGFITEANNRGLPEANIMKHSRHKSLAMMRHYDRHSGHWIRNPSTNMGL